MYCTEVCEILYLRASNLIKIVANCYQHVRACVSLSLSFLFFILFLRSVIMIESSCFSPRLVASLSANQLPSPQRPIKNSTQSWNRSRHQAGHPWAAQTRPWELSPTLNSILKPYHTIKIGQGLDRAQA